MRFLTFISVLLLSIPVWAKGPDSSGKCYVLFAAYIAVWVVTLIFVLRLSSKFSKLKQELKELKESSLK